MIRFDGERPDTPAKHLRCGEGRRVLQGKACTASERQYSVTPDSRTWVTGGNPATSRPLDRSIVKTADARDSDYLRTGSSWAVFTMLHR